jgi:hypothetical protein
MQRFAEQIFVCNRLLDAGIKVVLSEGKPHRLLTGGNVSAGATFAAVTAEPQVCVDLCMELTVLPRLSKAIQAGLHTSGRVA